MRRERSARPSAFATLRGFCRSPGRALAMAGVRRLRHGEYAEKFSSLQNARRCGEIAQAGLPPRTVTGQATPASMWRGMLSEVQIAASGVRLGLIRLAAGRSEERRVG